MKAIELVIHSYIEIQEQKGVVGGRGDRMDQKKAKNVTADL